MSAKTSDRCHVAILTSDDTDDKEHSGYAPQDMGIGGGDYVCFAWCLECGKIQNDERGGVVFPLPPCALEEK